MALLEGKTSFGLEYSVHGKLTALTALCRDPSQSLAPNAACPSKISAEVSSVLPSADLSKLLIISTAQRSVSCHHHVQAAGYLPFLLEWVCMGLNGTE